MVEGGEKLGMEMLDRIMKVLQYMYLVHLFSPLMCVPVSANQYVPSFC